MAFFPHVAEIAEYCLSEAPLALSYRQTANSSVECVEYRGLGGGLWVDTGFVVTPCDVHHLQLGASSSKPSPFFTGRRGIAERINAALDAAAVSKRQLAQVMGPNSLVVHCLERGETYRFEPLMSLGLSGDIAEQVVRQVEAFEYVLDDFVIIDGRIHRREPAPLIRLFPDGKSLSASIERRGYASHPIMVAGDVPLSVGWFCMDDLAGLLQEASAILERMGSPGQLRDWISHLEVHERSLVAASTEAMAVYDVADAMRRHFHECMANDGAGEKPGAAIGRWLANSSARDVRFFKAMCRKPQGEPAEDELPPELEEAFMAIAEDASGQFTNFTGRGHLRIFVEEVARRWRDRPITLEIVGLR